MECLLSAKQLHTFSHLCFRTALKYSSNSTGYKTKVETGQETSSRPLVCGGVSIQNKQ